MSTPVYVLPDSHEYSKYHLAHKLYEMVTRWEDINSVGTKTPAEAVVFGCIRGVRAGWDRYPEMLEKAIDEFGVKSYERKAGLIADSMPDVLFLEEYSVYRPLFRLLPRLGTDIIESLTESNNPAREFSSHRPIYDVCQKTGIKIVPIDDKDLMEEYMQVSYLVKAIIKNGGEEQKKDIPALKARADGITLKRSKKMLSLISEEIGADPGRVFVAMVGTMHYENFKKEESGIDILHIDKRFEHLRISSRL